MGTVTIQRFTYKNPISMIGEEAGVCWGADTSDPEKNYKRGLDCLENEHGRTFEFPDVYMILDGYSARVIREWYTHIGGAPTRLQASTRYIDYESGFDYVTPPSIAGNSAAVKVYDWIMKCIQTGLKMLEGSGHIWSIITLCRSVNTSGSAGRRSPAAEKEGELRNENRLHFG